MKTAVAALALTALVAIGMVRLAEQPKRTSHVPLSPPIVCHIDVLDVRGRGVHKLCSNGVSYWRPSLGAWRVEDDDGWWPLPGTPAW